MNNSTFIELRAGLTIQRDSIAVNINFLDGTDVFVSRHGYGADLPHNCLDLKRYPQDQFKKMLMEAIQKGAAVFHAVGSEDLPLPQELIAEEVLINHCPQCKAPQEDHDGLGVLYCEACDYCTHASCSYPSDLYDLPACDFCGTMITEELRHD